MIAPQRKRHFISWILLALGLPALVILAVINIPQFPTEEGYVQPPTAEGAILKSVENDQLTISLRGEGEQVRQLEILVKESFKSPFPVIYPLQGETRGAALIGDGIGGKGLYRFALDEVISGIEVWDPVKEVELTKLNF